MRLRLWIAAGSLSVVLVCGCRKQTRNEVEPAASKGVEPSGEKSVETTEPPGGTATRVYMHNVDLHETPNLTLRIRWLRGVLTPAKAGTVPSFDDPRSFVLTIEDGVLGISYADLSYALDHSVLKNSSLRNARVTGQDGKLKLTGTLHKLISLPVTAMSTVSAAPDGRARIHIEKISVMKIPVKGLLGVFDVKAGDLIDTKGGSGMEVHGNDLLLDPEKLLPEPRKRGRITGIRLENGEIVESYGDARADLLKRQDWRNYIAVFGGTLGFGKLIMRQADIVMIDVSKENWFEFDVARYSEQLVNGYMKITEKSGLRLFIPGITSVPKGHRSVSLEWMKNRNLPPPDPMATP